MPPGTPFKIGAPLFLALCAGAGVAYGVAGLGIWLTRRKFKCRNCHHQFSVTSGTSFASRKIDFVDLPAAICITVNAAKGVSMIQLSRDLGCQYKTAFVLAHKLREAMGREVQTGEVLNGHVEIDGAYFGGHIRPENAKADRKDRRLKEHQTGKRRVVVAL